LAGTNGHAEEVPSNSGAGFANADANANGNTMAKEQRRRAARRQEEKEKKRLLRNIELVVNFEMNSNRGWQLARILWELKIAHVVHAWVW